jgi:ATP-dependent DNA helicase RecG
VDDEWVSSFEQALSYELTAAQRRAIADIRRDIAGDVPMNRLLQGDVGSGKTVVAALAMGIAVANNTQAALMAPTSILAEQHFANLSATFDASLLSGQVSVALLTGSTPPGEREAIYAGLADGSIHVVVGTHALIQAGVEFARLGLAVIDEQHRFGVAQRGALRDKAGDGNPHLLVMTATPIPRTLALTLHADLDLTVIDEMPPGRLPVQTRILQPKERQRAYSFIRSQVEKGHQAFIIYPLIEESDKLNARAATAEYKRLQESIFPDLSLGLLHGRMSADEKEAVMAAFYRGETHILVSTSVIEVGIDVPNATVMMVENANRFGLAQLHQLRGRVGRGGNESYCLLMSEDAFFESDERLKAMEETSDGFRLAEIDWEMRGAGDLLGYRQSGLGDLNFADLMDSRLVEQVQHEARAIYDVDPELQRPEHQALAERVAQLGSPGDMS